MEWSGNMGKPMLSALVTFYNQEDYVDIAMKSIMMQKTDFDFEVLVGDDGSDDGTVEKINQWIKRYPEQIKLYVMPRDKDKEYFGSFRFCQNRLNLLNHVTGKYFAFLDGDDYYTVDYKFQKQVDILENPENDDCIACAHDIEKVYSDGKRKRLCAGRLKERKIDIEEFWKNYYLSAENFIVRSNVISKIPQELLNNTFEDIIQTFFVLQYGKLYYIPEVMAAYVQTDVGLWTAGNRITNCISNMIRYDIAIKINPSMEKITDKKFSHVWWEILKERKILSSEKYSILYKEACDKELKYSRMWLEFQKLSVVQKGSLYKKTFQIVSKVNFSKIKNQIIMWLINMRRR